MHNYFCDYCGAALDPCEVCDCRREEAGAAERKIITMDDWRRAGDFEKAARPGDLVTDEIVENFLNVLPPATNSATLVQCGEPVSHQYDPDTGHWRPTYTTFSQRDGLWYYCGNCFIGKRVEPRKMAGATV